MFYKPNYIAKRIPETIMVFDDYVSVSCDQVCK